MLGSLLSMIEKPTAENIAQREAEAQARARTQIVHSPHVLLECEKDFVRQTGRTPDNFAAMMLIGNLQVVKNTNTGTHLFIVTCEIPKGFFPDLESTILNADNSLSTGRFDRKIGCPIGMRLVLEKSALGKQGDVDMQKNVELIMEHEGKTHGELEDSGYTPPHGRVSSQGRLP
jgi:hypothetical protein